MGRYSFAFLKETLHFSHNPTKLDFVLLGGNKTWKTTQIRNVKCLLTISEVIFNRHIRKCTLKSISFLMFICDVTQKIHNACTVLLPISTHLLKIYFRGRGFVRCLGCGPKYPNYVDINIFLF